MPVNKNNVRVTLKDVALHAGVSQSAASTVLSGRSNGIRVNAATEARIRDAAAAVGYLRRKKRDSTDYLSGGSRHFAPSLHERLSNAPALAPGIIARYSHDPNGASVDPWDDDTPAAFEHAIGEFRPVTTRYCNRWRIGQPNVPMETAVRSLIDAGANALLVVDMDDTETVASYVPLLVESGLPFVIVSAGPLHVSVANICCDDQAAGYQAATHLIQQGHRELTFFAPLDTDWADRRLNGVRTAVKQAGLPPSCLNVWPEDRGPIVPNELWETVVTASEKSAAAGFDLGQIKPGVIAASDAAAVAAANAAKAAGRSLWQDIAVIGFDDVPTTRFMGISTMRAPRTEMGIKAAELLFRQWQGQRCDDLICLRSVVMVRESTTEWRPTVG